MLEGHILCVHVNWVLIKQIDIDLGCGWRIFLMVGLVI